MPQGPEVSGKQTTYGKMGEKIIIANENNVSDRKTLAILSNGFRLS
jgi:hypothetical protein